MPPGIIENPVPTFYFRREAWDYMDKCANLVDTEVGGLGYATIDEKDNAVIVEEVFVMNQLVSFGGVHFDSDTLAAAIEKAWGEGKHDKLRFSWHSHGNGPTFWSSTDESGIDAYFKGGMPWLASYVLNQDGEFMARLDVNNIPIVNRHTWNEVECYTLIDDDVEKRALKDMEAFVVEEVQPIVTFGGLGPRKQKREKTEVYIENENEVDRRSWQKILDEVNQEDFDYAESYGMAGDGWLDGSVGVEIVDEDVEKPGDDALCNEKAIMPHELLSLRKNGFKPEEMDDDHIIDALIEISEKHK